MDGGAWWATVHGVAKSQIRLSDFTFTFHSSHTSIYLSIYLSSICFIYNLPLYLPICLSFIYYLYLPIYQLSIYISIS